MLGDGASWFGFVCVSQEDSKEESLEGVGEVASLSDMPFMQCLNSKPHKKMMSEQHTNM